MSVLNAVVQRYSGPFGAFALIRERWEMMMRGHNLVVDYNPTRNRYSLAFWHRGRWAFSTSASTSMELAAKVDGFLTSQSASRQDVFATLLDHQWLLCTLSRKAKIEEALQAIADVQNRRRDSGVHGVELLVDEYAPASIRMRFGGFVLEAACDRSSALCEMLLTPTWVMTSGQLHRYHSMVIHELNRIRNGGSVSQLDESLERASNLLQRISSESALARQCVWVWANGEGFVVSWSLDSNEGETRFVGPDAHVRAYYLTKRMLHRGRKIGPTKLADMSEDVVYALLVAHHENRYIVRC